MFLVEVEERDASSGAMGAAANAGAAIGSANALSNNMGATRLNKCLGKSTYIGMRGLLYIKFKNLICGCFCSICFNKFKISGFFKSLRVNSNLGISFLSGFCNNFLICASALVIRWA